VSEGYLEESERRIPGREWAKDTWKRVSEGYLEERRENVDRKLQVQLEEDW